MAVYLFPFEKIPVGSDVIIYGAGNVGKSFVKQILMTDYCNIVAWVDKEYTKKSNRYRKVEPITVINQLNYDYIVVSVNESSMGLQITHELMALDIQAEKIIFVEQRYVTSIDSEITLEEILNNYHSIAELIKEYQERNLNGTDYFINILRDLNFTDVKDKSAKKEKLFHLIKDYICEENDTDAIEIATRLLFDIGCFDQECMKLAVNNANRIEKISKKYWMAVNIGLFEFFYPNSVYDEYYTDKRQLYISINDGLMKGRTLPQKHKYTGKKRIVILAQFLHKLDESLTKFVTMYANELVHSDYEVHIVLEEPFLYYDKEASIWPLAATTISSLGYEDDFIGYLDKNVIIHYAPEEPIEERHFSIISDIFNINPNVILDMCAKHSFLSAELYKHFPVICVSTGHNCNASLFHKYICRGKDLCIEANRICKSVLPSQMIELPIGTVFPEAKYQYNRKDFGFETTDFLLVVVGKRLDVDVSEEFAEELIRLLNKYSEMKLLLVGGKTKIFDNKYSDYINNKQVIMWGYEEDLPSLYRICDVFLNPDRTGGGWGITWAIGEELPVLSTDFPNDCTLMLGDMILSGGYPAMMREVENMFLDTSYYQKWKKMTKQRKNACSFETKIQKLIEVCDEIDI